jgi:hypothetical protein
MIACVRLIDGNTIVMSFKQYAFSGRNRNTVRPELRGFGISVGLALALIGLWPALWRVESPRYWVLVPAGAVLSLGLFVPALLRKPFDLWMRLAFALGWINTRVLLTVLFYLVLTPTAVIMKLVGFDPMNRKFLEKEDSYRIPGNPRPASHMKHQF